MDERVRSSLISNFWDLGLVQKAELKLNEFGAQKYPSQSVPFIKVICIKVLLKLNGCGSCHC